MGLSAHIAAGSAFAQQARPERPDRGLFGSGTTAEAEELLVASGSVGAGYDTSVRSDAGDTGIGGGITVPTVSESGGFALLSGALAYSLNKRRAGFSASASSSNRLYPTLSNTLISSYGAGVGASWSPSTRTHFNVNQTMSYQPYSLYSLYPAFQPLPLGQAPVSDLDFNTVQRGYYTYWTNAGVSRQLSRRATISGDYSYQMSDFTGQRPDFTSQTAGVRFTRGLTNGLGVRIGYGYSQARYRNDDRRNVGRHLLDTGVDYNKRLSFSRRTTLSFSTGGSAVTDRDSTYVTAVGTANLNHEIGRSWNFFTAYNRNIGFVETFAAPVISDSVNVGLTGLFTRQWEFHSGAGAVLGSIGVGSSAPRSNGFDTLYATTGVARALNRNLSVGVDYSFYRYAFEQNALLPAGFTTDLGRHSVRATLNAWAPLYQRGRRRDATR